MSISKECMAGDHLINIKDMFDDYGNPSKEVLCQRCGYWFKTDTNPEQMDAEVGLSSSSSTLKPKGRFWRVG